MAYLTYSDITGAVLLSFVGLPNIGMFDEVAINQNKTSQGQWASAIGMATLAMDEAAAFAGVERNNFTQVQENHYNASVQYYAAHLLKKRDNELAPDKCKPSDEEQCQYWLMHSCDFLKKADTTLHSYAAFCDEETCVKLDDDSFGASIYDSRCKEWDEAVSYVKTSPSSSGVDYPLTLITNQLSDEDANYLYISFVKNGFWQVTRYDRNNSALPAETAGITNNPSQTTQPTTLDEYQTLTYS